MADKSPEEILEEADKILKESEKLGSRPEAKTEKEPEPAPKSAEVFGDSDSRGTFEKLPDKTREFAAGLYERAKMNIVDRAKVMFNDKLFDWHHEKSTLLRFKVEEKESDIQRLEELKAGHSERLASIQKELGPVSPKLLAKAELEKEEIQKNIDREKGKLDKLEWKFNYRDEKENTYKTRRNRICEGVIEKTNERLAPYEEKLEKLRGDRESIAFEIKSFRDKNKESSERIKDLENKMKAAPLKIERKIYRAYIKAFEKNIRENEKLINKTIKQEAKIGNQVAKFEKKAGPWREKRNEFERVMRRGSEGAGREGEPKRKIEEEPLEEKEEEAKGGPEIAEEVEEEEEKPQWDSISDKERRFWVDRFGKGGAKNIFKQYEGDFEDLARYRKNQKKYVEEWKKLREEIE